MPHQRRLGLSDIVFWYSIGTVLALWGLVLLHMHSNVEAMFAAFASVVVLGWVLWRTL